MSAMRKRLLDTEGFAAAIVAALERVDHTSIGLITNEQRTVGNADPKVVRALARELAGRLRQQVHDVRALLEAAGQLDSAAAALLAQEALTEVIARTCESPALEPSLPGESRRPSARQLRPIDGGRS